jgi:hypothetical protein
VPWERDALVAAQGTRHGASRVVPRAAPWSLRTSGRSSSTHGVFEATLWLAMAKERCAVVRSSTLSGKLGRRQETPCAKAWRPIRVQPANPSQQSPRRRHPPPRRPRYAWTGARSEALPSPSMASTARNEPRAATRRTT